MRITEPGLYVLTERISTKGAFSIAHLPAGTVIEVTQIDELNGKVIAPQMEDWHSWDIPAARIE